MTEEAVRAVFDKRYFDRDLNEAMMAASEEISLVLLAKHAESGKTLPDIVKTIARGKSCIYLFAGVAASGHILPIIPMKHLFYFDEIRKAIFDVINYAHDHYETMQPWFQKKFLPEDLRGIASEMSQAIERPSGLPANTRGLNLAELKLEDEIFTSVLVGILGVERFQKYAEEYNRCAAILRRCQAEYKMLETMPPATES